MTPVFNRGTLRAALEDTLLELIEEAGNEHDSLDDPRELREIGDLLQKFPQADARVLEQLFRGRPDAGDLTKHFDRYMHLPVVRTTSPPIYPVMTFAYDWPKQVLRLRFALFYRPPANASQPPLVAFGMRFETPESWVQDVASESPDPDPDGGKHDMFHAQPVSRLHVEVSRSTLPGLRWLNVAQPSIPVAARDLAGLVLTVLISIYGRRHIADRYKLGKLRGLRKAAEQVNCLPRPPERAADRL